MSSVQRKEYQETKILRTVSPVRNTRGSTQNLEKFDSNLDYLLEDLQNSVSRPGSALGNTNTYRETSRSINSVNSPRSNSLSRINKSSNPVEYSSDDAYSYTSPDGRKKVTGYKKETFSYKTSGGGDVPPEKIRMQNSINQLDTLLDDLQQVKKSSFSEKDSYSTSGLDPNFQTSTTSKRSVNRELHYGDTPRPSSRSRTLERSERESSLTRDVQYSGEGTYGDLRPLRTTSPSPSRTSTLTKQTKVANVKNYPVEVVETSVPDIDPEVLAHLDPNLRPPGNTKVTTTIKTYTYEIPGSGNYPTNLEQVDNEKYVYSPNQSQTTPSKSFVYNKLDKSSENIIYQKDSYPPYQKPSPPEWEKETITTRNYQPGQTVEQHPGNETYIYKETTTTKNINENGYPSYRRPSPPRQNTYIIKESNTVNTTNRIPYSERDYPVGNPPNPDNKGHPSYPDNRGNPPNTTYIIKETHNTTTTNRDYPRGNPPYPDNRENNPPSTYIIKETHNTTRNAGPPYQNGYPPDDKTIIYKHETHTTNNYLPDNRPKTPNDVERFDPRNPPYGRKPNEPVNIHYKYTTSSTTTNNYKAGYPPTEETQTLLPQRFPTDNEPDGGPPKRLDDLMATIGNEPPNSPLNSGFTAHEHDLAKQKKVDTLKQQSAEAEETQKKEVLPSTKNVAGPPVYYPPGHEMFAKKEEGGGAWRSEGAYGRTSGKYMYEAESKSKSKSSSGATVVPVCLPLCCGLPCVLL